MTVRPVLLLAAVAAVALLVTVGGYTVAHYAVAASDARAELAAKRAADARLAARRIPAPSLGSVTTYGPPYNVRIVCAVAGSTGDGGPLDGQAAPRPGDLYVKTCRALRLQPSG